MSSSSSVAATGTKAWAPDSIGASPSSTSPCPERPRSLCRRWCGGCVIAPAPARRIPGICHRSLPGAPPGQSPALPVADLETLPLPDYDDYFEALRTSGLTRRIRPSVHTETCRGCWWAAKHPCRFCGSPGCRRTLPSEEHEQGARAAPRTRGPHRLPGRSDPSSTTCPPLSSSIEALPRIAADPLRVPLFCEVRSEVTREHIRLLAAARASIQPGIESLTTTCYVSCARAAARWRTSVCCGGAAKKESRPSWNFMYGVPGEDPADYRRDARPCCRRSASWSRRTPAAP